MSNADRRDAAADHVRSEHTHDANAHRDANRDPISGAPGAHPVGVGVGGAGGAVVGAAVGSVLGPIGMLVGGAVGTVAGAAAGKGVAERIDPTGEAEYWREAHRERSYVKPEYDYENDYGPAYAFGGTSRAELSGRRWDDSLETELRDRWDTTGKGSSRLAWDDAKHAVRDAWERDDRSYRTYEASDRHYRDQYAQADYAKPDYGYDEDYRQAYRYGTYARSRAPHAEWNERTESDLERGWERARGESRLAWNEAKHAVRDAWHGIERVLPGDADRDGR